ncbi:hypothetical protein DFP81_101113 [Marinomonas pollencensis]|uniref:Uncharacterized protein n=1 Tax=Marinomonas pollencensis TaxID=491954 RepID=A0A3E0DUG6_9GAMM|nr:hypothetical protein DFP81_101113 [Marinomonas pollencensis]
MNYATLSLGVFAILFLGLALTIAILQIKKIKKSKK